jgi:hypothetical protein
LCRNRAFGGTFLLRLAEGRKEKPMITRKHYLATAAGIALALAISAPSFAQQEVGPNGPQVSTPAEKAQTQTLNSAQPTGSYVDPAVANGAASPSQPVPAEGVAAAASQTSTIDAQTEAQQQQYQAQRQDYMAQQQQYANTEDTYEHQRAAYEFERRHPATWWHDRYEHARYIKLFTVDRPDLLEVAVTDRNGFLVGKIDDLNRATDGHIIRVRLRLNEGRMAWIEGDAIRYYPEDKLMMVDLTPRQIWERSAPI